MQKSRRTLRPSVQILPARFGAPPNDSQQIFHGVLGEFLSRPHVGSDVQAGHGHLIGDFGDRGGLGIRGHSGGSGEEMQNHSVKKRKI